MSGWGAKKQICTVATINLMTSVATYKADMLEWISVNEMVFEPSCGVKRRNKLILSCNWE